MIGAADMPFIVYEGSNLCGKSTQLERQALHLGEKYKVKTIKSPTQTDVGRFAREYSLANPNDAIRNFFMYMADATALTEDIRTKMGDYDFVLCDRYFWTTLTINNVKSGGKFDALVVEMLKRGDLLYPDQTILFNVSLEERKKRSRGRSMNSLDYVSMGEKIHNDLAAEYERLSKEYPGWVVIDTDGRTEEDISAEVIHKLAMRESGLGNPFRTSGRLPV
jgi:thymidylate kinase